MKSSFLSTFQGLAWAEQQKYGSALEKLVVMRIASASAIESGDYNWLPLEFDELAVYCCESAIACADALEELRRRGLVVVGAAGKTGAEVALPWWLETHVFETPASLKPLGYDFRAVAAQCQDNRCWYCGGQFGDLTPHLEHQIPRARGGQDIIDNLVLACPPCNTSKGAKTVTEFRAVRAAEAGRKNYRFWGEAR